MPQEQSSLFNKKYNEIIILLHYECEIKSLTKHSYCEYINVPTLVRKIGEALGVKSCPSKHFYSFPQCVIT